MSGTRLTITDIARRARVSTSAVSYALNDRPGVSDSTRARILAIADSLGWRPSSAARTLHSAHTNALGLLLLGPEDSDADSAYFLFDFLIGVQNELAAQDVLLVLYTAPDVASANQIYRRWRAEHRVDGVMLMNPLLDDPRIPVLTELEMPAVVVGDTRRTASLPAVWTDDRHAAGIAVDYLAQLGHRRIARVGICPDYLHSEIRRKAYVAAMRHSGLTPDVRPQPHDISNHELILRMLRAKRPPTAVIFEDPNVAVRATVELQKAGVAIPDELSVIAWDDTTPCRLVQPALTTLRRDVRQYGRLVTRRLLDTVRGEPAGHVKGTTTTLVVRDSTKSPKTAKRIDT